MDTNATRELDTQIKSWPDRLNLLLGGFLLLWSWLAAGSSVACTWNAVIFGAAIAVAAIFAIAKPAVRPEWANVGFGLWLLVAPWALGFSEVPGSVWVNVLVGIFVIYLAGMQIVLLKRPITTRRTSRAR